MINIDDTFKKRLAVDLQQTKEVEIYFMFIFQLPVDAKNSEVEELFILIKSKFNCGIYQLKPSDLTFLMTVPINNTREFDLDSLIIHLIDVRYKFKVELSGYGFCRQDIDEFKGPRIGVPKIY